MRSTIAIASGKMAGAHRRAGLFAGIGIIAASLALLSAVLNAAAAPAPVSTISGLPGFGPAGGTPASATPTYSPTRTPTNSPTQGPDWTIQASPNQGSYDNVLNGVAAIAANNVWVVGEYNTDNTGGPRQTLIEHWYGTGWALLQSPNPGSADNGLESVSVGSVFTDDVWAVGAYRNIGGSRQTLVEHWDHGVWTIVPSPNPGDSSRLTAVSSDRFGSNVWAVGSYIIGSVEQPLIEHWNGTAWSVVDSPHVGIGGRLEGVSAGLLDAWAVGFYNPPFGGVQQTLIEHWDGFNGWRVIPSPNQGSLGNELASISTVPDGNVFAVGDYQSGVAAQEHHTLIEHWNGTAWTILDSPNPGQDYNALGGVVAVTADCSDTCTYDVWAAGEYGTSISPHQTLVERLDGFLWGVERTENQGTGDNALVAIDGDTSYDVWAVGQYRDGAGTRRTLVERYNHCLTCPTATPTPILASTPTPTPQLCSVAFADVPPDNGFYANIICLACRGIVSGYTCGSSNNEPCTPPNNLPYFRPYNNVTRAQLSKIISMAAGFNDPQPDQMFEDVPVGSTFQVYIGQLASRGFVGGYSCGGPGEPCGPGSLPYFRPNTNATRGQISKIVANTAGFNDVPAGQQFQDVPPGSTYYPFIYRLYSHSLMSGYPCGSIDPLEPCLPPGNLPYFRPFNNATRAQTSKITGNTFYPNCQTPEGVKR